MEVRYPSTHEGEGAIQISVRSEAELQSLVEALTRLSEGQSAAVDLSELSATFDGVRGVMMITDADEHVVLQGGRCEWACTRDAWDVGIDMLHAVHRKGRGFQYLPPNSLDGLVVELFYQGPANPKAGWGRFRDDE